MASSNITEIITPLVIVFIMFGLGLTLTLSDFKRVLLHPKSMVIGILLQIIGLPLLGFAFVSILELDPLLSVSIMLLSACPGGAITNLVSFVCRGDAALSVSLTAVNSFITVVTIPLVVTFSLTHFLGGEVAAQINLMRLSMGIVLITIPPITIGMLIKNKIPEFAEKSEKLVRAGTMVFLVLLAVFAGFQERSLILENYKQYTILAVALFFLSATMGFLGGYIARLGQKHILTLAIEVGLHNSGMGIVIAVSLLGNPALSIFSAFYLLMEYVMSGVLMAAVNSPIGKKLVEVE